MAVCTLSNHMRRKIEGEGGCESAETRIVRDPGAVLHFPRSRGAAKLVYSRAWHIGSLLHLGGHVNTFHKNAKMKNYVRI